MTVETQVDFVVLGAGPAGLSAAVTAVAEGASVMVLESAATVGGSAAISGGYVWAIESAERLREEDGYFPTGDLLMTHEDGTISIMGREKDVIIRGGRNIDITEIERAVAGYPRVARACVAAVPDEVLGERVALLVVTEDGGGIDLAEVTGHLESVGLSKAKWPEFVYAIEELPQTKVGKLDRSGARELAQRLRAHSRTGPHHSGTPAKGEL
ncbi:FAD-binding protein [Streptomyces sp. NPDC059863]|uniref:AMP-binding enzyme n=1 Tax=unclassified Streptomyces TaxID=2593676 RepID=UPI0036572251